jgi:zinc transport system permease protein
MMTKAGMPMIDMFLIMAALAGLGVSVVVGPLGSFVVWRRMAYFGDATAHAAILGVALAIATDIPIILGVVIVALAIAALVARLAENGHSMDIGLGVVSHGALALGVLAVSLSGGPRGDLLGYLFGDILTVTLTDLATIWGGALFALAVLVWRWPTMLTATLSPELALAGGGRPARERLILSLLLALVVAISLKVVGALLIAAMLIIPAAAARPWANTPEAMAVIAVLIAAASVVVGLGASFMFDSPTGPTIVAAAAVIFGLTNATRGLKFG